MSYTYTIDQIKQKLNYAKDFTPHKVAYYEQLLKEAQPTPVIVSKYDFQLDGETLTRVNFLALDQWGKILQRFVCPKQQASEHIDNYCSQYNYVIV